MKPLNKKGKKVYKYDPAGKLVNTFNSIWDAQIAEKISYSTLRRVIKSGEEYNGFTYSLQVGAEFRQRTNDTGPLEPWEGKNGFFNVDKWAKCLPI